MLLWEEKRNVFMTKKNHFHIWAIVVSFLIGIFLILSTYYLNATTSYTADGIWESFKIKASLAGEARPFDLVHPIYERFMVFFWEFLGLESWPGSFLQKMAVINSIMAGLAIFAFVLLMKEIGVDYRILFSTTVFYLFSIYFFQCAISSENAMPPLAFFWLAVFFLGVYLKHKKLLFAGCCGLSFSVSILLRLSMAVSFPAFMIAYLFQQAELRNKLKSLSCFFLGSVFPFLVMSCFVGPSVINILKPGYEGWRGFSWYKVGHTFRLGIGNSLVSNKYYDFIGFLKVGKLIPQILTLGLVAFLVFAMIKTCRQKKWLSALSFFLLVNFALHELFNLYYLGMDPQFQLAPLIIIPLSMAIISKTWHKNYYWRFLIVILALLIPLATTYEFLRFRKGCDQEPIDYFTRLSQQINPSKTIFVSFGFDIFPSWGRMVLNLPLREHFIYFTHYLVNYPKASAKELGKLMLADISAGRKKGYEVMAPNIIFLPDEKLLARTRLFDSTDRVVVLRKMLLANYKCEKFMDTSRGPIYRLISKNSQKEDIY